MASPTHWMRVILARNLARAGYVVVTYDQLGFGDSPYELPQGGRALTVEASRFILHQVVGQVKAGDYGVDGTCSLGNGGATGTGSPKVILIGHSGGGGIVSGYPGQYHDVAAVVQSTWSNQSLNPQFFTPGHGGWNMVRQFATGSEHLFVFLDERGGFNRSQCETFAIYPHGIDADIRETFCGHPSIKTIGLPAGWLPTIFSIDAENQIFIDQVGPGLPVLIVWAEFDWLFRPEDREAEERHWRTHCGCDVTVWTLPDAGHGYQVHRSMPAFTNEVVSWLHSKGL